MSEERHPDYIVSIRTGRKIQSKIELFRKSKWTNDPSDDVLYRLRIDNAWYGGSHSEKTFLTSEAALALVKGQIVKGGVV